MTQINKDNIQQYHANNALRHYYYKDSVERYHDLNDHYIGKVKIDAVTDRRPNEDEDIKKYREKIAVNVTKRFLAKIIREFSAIRKAKDWNIYWDMEFKLPSVIVEAESLKAYTENNFPLYTSLTNWLFSQLLTQYTVDSNAIVVTMPNITYSPAKNTYLKPIPVIYNSDQVLDYKMNEYYVVQSKEAVFYTDGKYTYPGVSYYSIEPDVIIRYDQTSRTGDFAPVYKLPNKTKRLPVHHLYGVITDDNGQNILAESILAPMVPYLVEAMRYYNDFQIDMVMNAFSQYWSHATQTCKKCKGTGKSRTKSAEGAPLLCEGCGGDGKVRPGPTDTITVKKSIGGENPVTPPAGYIAKDPEIPKLLYEAFKQSGYDALSSVNFQNVDQGIIAQSGVAKAEDNEPRRIIMNAVAEDIVRIADLVMKDVCDWRYADLIISDEDRYKMLPKIYVPERFDMSSTTQMMTDMQALANSKVSPYLLSSMEGDFVEKHYSSNKEKGERVRMTLELNPFPGRTIEEIGMMKTYNMISETDVKLFLYIDMLIEEALATVKGFKELPRTEKMEKLREMAEAMNMDTEIQRAVEEAKNMQAESDKEETDNDTDGVNEDADNLGKLPLAIQQLSLAATRVAESGNKKLAAQINKKLNDLLGGIDV